MTKRDESAAWKDEERRQAQELADAIQDVISRQGRQLQKEGRAPILNAVAGALVTVTGSMLASIENPVHRKMMRRQMEKHLPSAVADAKPRGHAQTIMIGGPKQ